MLCFLFIEQHQQSPTILPPIDLIPSGGSSPSREVQEIMSLKDSSDCYFSESVKMDMLEETNALLTSVDNLTFDDFNVSELQESSVIEMTVNLKQDNIDGGRSNTTNDWPKVPDVPIMQQQQQPQQPSSTGKITPQELTPPSSSELQQQQQPPRSSSTTPSSTSTKIITNNQQSNEHVVVEQQTNHNISTAQMNQMYNKMDQMIELVQAQTGQIKDLKKQLNALQKSKGDEYAKMYQKSAQLEASLSKLIEEYLIRYERQHKTKLEGFLAAK